MLAINKTRMAAIPPENRVDVMSLIIVDIPWKYSVGPLKDVLKSGCKFNMPSGPDSLV